MIITSVGSSCVSINAKDIVNLIKSIKARFDSKWKSLVNLESVLVHKDCQKTYTRSDTIQNILMNKKIRIIFLNSPIKDKIRYYTYI